MTGPPSVNAVAGCSFVHMGHECAPRAASGWPRDNPRGKRKRIDDVDCGLVNEAKRDGCDIREPELAEQRQVQVARLFVTLHEPAADGRLD
jgi:hypothetical protein